MEVLLILDCSSQIPGMANDMANDMDNIMENYGTLWNIMEVLFT